MTDRETKAGVPYVSIYSCTSSAEDGSYEIALPSGFKGSVIFSLFGYQRDTMAVAKLLKHPNVRLRKGGMALRSVTVKAYTPKGLLEEVVRRIPDNYRTDTTINRFFSQRCYLLNDSVYLYYENIFESLRVGYGTFIKKRRVGNGDGGRMINSNYNRNLISRPAVTDSAYLFKFFRSRYLVRKMLSYDDFWTILDHMEVPNASYIFNKHGWHRMKMELNEYEDSTGERYYVLNIDNERKKQKYAVTIEAKSLAVISIILDVDSICEKYPSGGGYREYHPYASSCTNHIHREFRYEKIDGKYTLFSDYQESDMTYICHNEYRWADAPTVQHYHSYILLQLISQSEGDASYFKHDDLLGTEKELFIKLPSEKQVDDKDFWSGINHRPLPAEVQAAADEAMHSDRQATEKNNP